MTTNPFITDLINHSEINTKNNTSFTTQAAKLINKGCITDEEIMRHITGERNDNRLHCDLTQSEIIHYESHIDSLIK